MSGELLSVYLATICVLAASGLYTLLVTQNLIRTIIGLELLTKAVTVGLILTGKLTGKLGLGQALVITVIVIEVVVMVVAVGLVLLAHRHTGQVDSRLLRNLKG
jgi:multisubunit Na+/H+ antiporter MnhC subunit